MQGAKVFFCPISARSSIPERQQAMSKILSALQFSNIVKQHDKVAVKTHIGDSNNDTHISPSLIALVVQEIKKHEALPYLTETSTLYSGPRSNAITHLKLAEKHGFTYENVGAPFIMSDGLFGNTEIEVPIDGILFDKVNIARDAVLTDALIVLSHPTGHMLSGIGACLKNLGMGLSSRKGKLLQHSSIKPYINPDECTLCGQCIKWCPVAAIIEKDGKAFIDDKICIGCGECLTLCKYSAVKFNWGVGSEDIQKRIAEYALGAIQNKRDKSVFINVLTDMTKECDCMSIKQTPVIDDIGILASADPVAIDMATLDLTENANRENLSKISHPGLDPLVQLKHAEKIGLGSREYELISI